MSGTMSKAEQEVLRASRLIWHVPLWPLADRVIWTRARLGSGLEGRDNPATLWSQRTLKNNENGYGRYLSWLSREGLLVEDEGIAARITSGRVAKYVEHLKASLSPVSVVMAVAQMIAAARALAPDVDWSWLKRRCARLKRYAKPSREKRHVVQHTFDLYRYGKQLMDEADQGGGGKLSATMRYQAGLIIALLAARPLRIRNFQAITIGKSLRWADRHYWLVFGTGDTKTGAAIEEPVPDDLVPYLEAFIRFRRPVLLRRRSEGSNMPPHRALWVDWSGQPLKEATLRAIIERYTKRRFGIAIWPHLFRDCLLTSVAINTPDLMRVSASLLGHSSLRTGEKHYNQARMIDASRQFAGTVSDLRENFLSIYRAPRDGSNS